MRTRAAIFIQRGAPERKQQELCLGLIETEQWQLAGIVPHSAARDAAALVSAGAVDVIVTAFDSHAAQSLATAIAPRGKVVYVHPQPTEIKVRSPLPSMVELILRWRKRGRTVDEIAREVGSETTDIREVLRKWGEQPGRSD